MNESSGKKISSIIADIKNIIEQGRREAYSSVGSIMIETYWQIGKRIVEEEQGGLERAVYGDQLIDKLSKQLTHDYGEGFSARYLRAFRKFYVTVPNYEIWKSRFPNLQWTHIFRTLRVGDETAIRWYLETASQEMWSVRTLDRNISTQYYERHFIQPQGQMDMYRRMYDELKRTEGDNPTIGIVLCSDTDSDIAKYSILNGNEQLFAAKYLPFLPTEEELRREIERQKEIYMLQQQK